MRLARFLLDVIDTRASRSSEGNPRQRRKESLFASSSNLERLMILRERYKAYLVTKGYTQQKGLDYHETFSLVAKLVTVKTLLALAVIKGWTLHQFGFNNAFVHGKLEKEVYMQIPPGYSVQGPNKVCKLKKSLYGLKTGLPTVVDDIIVASNDTQAISELKGFLDTKFKITDIESFKYFLDLEVARNPTGIQICQRKHALDIQHDSGQLGFKPTSIPMDPNFKLSKDEGNLLHDPALYRRLIGRLLQLTTTRLDPSYSIHLLSQYMAAPHVSHLQAAYKVLRYIKKSPGQGLFFASSSSYQLTAYCDSDWASCPDTRRSTTEYCVFLGHSLISWKTKKQMIVSRSFDKAEYRSMVAASCEISWLKYLLVDLTISHSQQAFLYCNNQAALHIVANPVFHVPNKLN
ncbi:hypothetical protein F2P56_007379 [Juglans regia]|uniref:Reverse transcriptase Ty1/copia-type domain-containing protein n=1 Tax=Juglans regia TaxID=51240 RepID=A0A833Y3B7_JUGRE|nr:hypothetical protein F2P56_007379 [Juglans regia]